jgi:hypothetical protein
MHVVERATEKITTFLNGNDIKINRSGRVNDLISVMEIVLGDDMVSLIITEYGKCSIELDYFYHYMNGSQGEHPAIRLEFHDIIVDDVSFINMFDKTLYIVSKTIKKFKEELYFVIGEEWMVNKEISEMLEDIEDFNLVKKYIDRAIDKLMNLLQCPESINERRDYIITLIDMYAKQLVNDMEIRDMELLCYPSYNDLKSMMKEEEE